MSWCSLSHSFATFPYAYAYAYPNTTIADPTITFSNAKDVSLGYRERPVHRPG